MANYIMTAKELILTSGSSRGSQIKFFKDDYWYKLDENGPEGKAEELASIILSCSNLSSDEYVKYESCKIEYEGNTYNGCRSKNFLLPGEQLFSYEKIYNIMTGRSLTEDIIPLESPEERIAFVCKVINGFSGLDVRNSIAKNLTASMVLLETDRHLNNMAIIANKDLTGFREAPIFDNGASFLSNYSIYPPSISIEDIKNDNISIIGKPFSANLEYQAYTAGLNIRFDFNKINKFLGTLEDSRMRRIAECSFNKYSKLSKLNMKESGKQSLVGTLQSKVEAADKQNNYAEYNRNDIEHTR